MSLFNKICQALIISAGAVNTAILAGEYNVGGTTQLAIAAVVPVVAAIMPLINTLVKK